MNEAIKYIFAHWLINNLEVILSVQISEKMILNNLQDF